MVNELEFRVLLLRWTGTSRSPSVTVTTSPFTLLTVPCCTNAMKESKSALALLMCEPYLRWAWPAYSICSISNEISPAGAWILTFSPTRLPINALPRGLS